jgi:hypothetical protein
MKIPTRFKLFGTTVNVVWDNKRMNDLNAFGLFEYGLSKITLSTIDGLDKLSEDRVMDCYYHERTHAILEAMHERELSANEDFVDVFSKLLRQADESAEF